MNKATIDTKMKTVSIEKDKCTLTIKDVSDIKLDIEDGYVSITVDSGGVKYAKSLVDEVVYAGYEDSEPVTVGKETYYLDGEVRVTNAKCVALPGPDNIMLCFNNEGTRIVSTTTMRIELEARDD